MLGELRFRYRVVPLHGRPEATALFNHAARLAAGLRNVQLRTQDVILSRNKTDTRLSQKGSCASLVGHAVLTSLRIVGKALELRLFNPHTRTVNIQLKQGSSISQDALRRVRIVDFESTLVRDSAPANDGVITHILHAKEIVTLQLEVFSESLFES